MDINAAVEIGGDGTAFFTFVCPECQRKNRVPVKGIRAGESITCACVKTTLELSGHDLDIIQRHVDRGEGFEITINVTQLEDDGAS